MTLFNALIRTHHITSRKKVANLKKAFSAPQNPGLTLVLLRTGSSPGMMYAEGREEAGVAGWVAAVQALRYKDFKIANRVGAVEQDSGAASPVKKRGQECGEERGRNKGGEDGLMGFREVETVHEFAHVMRARGLEAWWKRGMGYEKDTGGDGGG